MINTVSALFVESNSIYKTLLVDCYDEKRNALNFTGLNPIIAHPPCRLWSRLRKQSTAPETEKELALFAVDLVNKNGGVLEHPASSTLWSAANLPLPGQRNDNGFSIRIFQSWFGHPCRKDTWLYFSGLHPMDLDPLPIRYDRIDFKCGHSANKNLKEIEKSWRNRTPPDLAEWLIKQVNKINDL